MFLPSLVSQIWRGSLREASFEANATVGRVETPLTLRWRYLAVVAPRSILKSIQPDDGRDSKFGDRLLAFPYKVGDKRVALTPQLPNKHPDGVSGTSAFPSPRHASRSAGQLTRRRCECVELPVPGQLCLFIKAVRAD